MNWSRVSLFAGGSVHPLRAALVVLAAMGLLTIPAAVSAAPSNAATVQFGNPNAPGAAQNCERGNATTPPEPCANAFHKMIPGAVAIGAGDTVDFVRNGFHQVAIYAPGKRPNDVVVTPNAVPPGRVNDPVGRVYLGPAANGGTDTPPASAFTQSGPGRYLVICNIATHFGQNMWGWVQVQ
jgi:plastocyanin